MFNNVIIYLLYKAFILLLTLSLQYLLCSTLFFNDLLTISLSFSIFLFFLPRFDVINLNPFLTFVSVIKLHCGMLFNTSNIFNFKGT